MTIEEIKKYFSGSTVYVYNGSKLEMENYLKGIGCSHNQLVINDISYFAIPEHMAFDNENIKEI